jgi:hypothetical protein
MLKYFTISIFNVYFPVSAVRQPFKELEMNSGTTILSQTVDFFPLYEFNKCVKCYNGNYKVKSFTCLNQFYILSFAQLTYRESIRDIVACLTAMRSKLYHMGIRSEISKSTIADSLEQRDWRIMLILLRHSFL